MIERRRTSIFSAFVAITLTWSSMATAAHTYYVSPAGDDNANGKSPRTAWRTLDRVAGHSFARGDGLVLEGGAVHHGSIHLGPDRSAGNIEIGSYGTGRATIDAGNGSGIVISNLSGVTISTLEIRGSGQQSNTGDGILIVSQVDPIPADRIYYSDFLIDNVEVHDFKKFGILLHSHWGTGLRNGRVTRSVSP